MFVPQANVWRGLPSNGLSNNQTTAPLTGYFDTAAGTTPASAPANKPSSNGSQSQRRWSTKGDIWSFGLSLWSIAEGARPFAHLLEDEVLIAATGERFASCENAWRHDDSGSFQAESSFFYTESSQ